MGTPQRNLSAKAKDSRSGSSNEASESVRSVFERDSEKIDKPRFENVIKDVYRLSVVVAGGALLQFSSPVASRSERSRNLERTSETLLERSLFAGQRMAQVHEEAAT